MIAAVRSPRCSHRRVCCGFWHVGAKACAGIRCSARDGRGWRELSRREVLGRPGWREIWSEMLSPSKPATHIAVESLKLLRSIVERETLVGMWNQRLVLDNVRDDALLLQALLLLVLLVLGIHRELNRASAK
jgi:hypothetical protein